MRFRNGDLVEYHKNNMQERYVFIHYVQHGLLDCAVRYKWGKMPIALDSQRLTLISSAGRRVLIEQV